jgi:hypothetical protein
MISAMDLLYYFQRYPISITENYDNVHPVSKFFKSMLKELDFAGFRENPDPEDVEQLDQD